MSVRKRKSKTVPKTWLEWSTAARRHGVLRSSIHRQKKLESGSKVTEEQYLLLKVLWDIEWPTMRAVQDLNLQDFFDQARDWLATFHPFQAYLDTIDDDKTPGSSEIGIFEILREQQRQVCELLQSPGSKGLQSANEEIVNSSLLSFLTAICKKHPSFKARWTPQRASLTAEFRGAHMECLLDGLLASEATLQTQVIIEAKANRRGRHSPEVFMQEAAELVAALVTGPPKGLAKDRGLLISQMDQEKQAITKNEFLTIRQWGAWRIDKREEIEDFARLVLAEGGRPMGGFQLRFAPKTM
ncbi:uncharacterized protein N7515_009676 [Penicillium bovifimosum]|uniref:Uncharacterized protein n=1 Tax=Penicillium bovifimosum TaxID=126998 RepID=A0A9W9GGX5_9EURO|nr:uncharacterized protein N7515_009676 [Penicillium bovifimosum]KAJ5120288.1 hypothetical protein N7515_009676 [Penicillium bovifimosum]